MAKGLMLTGSYNGRNERPDLLSPIKEWDLQSFFTRSVLVSLVQSPRLIMKEKKILRDPSYSLRTQISRLK